METIIVQKLKQQAGRLIEKPFLKTGRVLAVRKGDIMGMIEIDLHLPSINMYAWKMVPYIKFSIGGFAYRDYTPSGWDAETSTCTLFVSAAHSGAGVLWAAGLQQGDEVLYVKTGSTHQAANSSKLTIALGDASSMGHLLALEQLSESNFIGALLLTDEDCCRSFSHTLQTTLQPVRQRKPRAEDCLMAWAEERSLLCPTTSFCLAGNQKMVLGLRSMLREAGILPANIKTQGFWG